jgi:hypothetical protein
MLNFRAVALSWLLGCATSTQKFDPPDNRQMPESNPAAAVQAKKGEVDALIDSMTAFERTQCGRDRWLGSPSLDSVHNCLTIAQIEEKDQREKAASAAATKASQQAAAEEHRAKATPKERALAWSAVFCSLENGRSQILAQILRERNYSALSGVQNNSRLYEWQEELRMLDEGLARMKRNVPASKSRHASCSTSAVRARIACINLSFLDQVEWLLSESDLCQDDALEGFRASLEPADEQE